MANDKKFIVKKGLVAPNVDFANGSGTISATYLNSSNTLSFSGNTGQLFSITDSMSGTIFSVNDISGIPSIEVMDTGAVKIAETFGTVAIGANTASGYKLYVNGNTLFGNSVTLNSTLIANGSVGTSGFVLTSNGTGVYWAADYANATNITSGTLAEARLPYRMNQNVRTTDNVTFANMTVTGNVVVSGTVTTWNANNISISDNMIYLNANGFNTNPDIGIAASYNDGTYRHTGFFRDATDGVWKVYDQYLPEPDASIYIDTANASFRIADFQANVVTLATAKIGSLDSGPNFISFRGTTNDGPGSYNHTYIGERIFSPTESSELFLFKGNDMAASGPDRVRIGAAEFRVDTYSSALSGDFETVANSALLTNKFIITNGGDVGIGTSSPSYKLDVNGLSNTRRLRIANSAGVSTGGNLIYPSDSGNDYLTIQGQNSTHSVRLKDSYNTSDYAVIEGGYTNQGLITLRGYSAQNTINNTSYYGSNYTTVNGIITGNASVRSPIFYDTDNTAYYIDPNSTSVAYNFTANYFGQRAHGEPRNNLGDPTVTEMALFQEQFNNKTEFYPANNVIFETSTDGSTWSAYSVTDSQKKSFVGGDNSANISIPYNTAYFRVRFVNNGNYVFLNQLYSWWSSNGHQTKVHIYYKLYNSTTWVQHTSSNTLVSSWPGHLWLPFPTIAYNSSNASQADEIAIVFIPTWKTSANPISLYKMQIWGGYPAGKRNIYSVDNDRNATFPVSARAPIFHDSDNTAYYLDPASTSIVNVMRSSNFENVAGDGNGLRFWTSDDYKIHMSAAGNATWGGRVSGETTSDYNMYFRMSGGTNRGFVFQNNTTSVAGIDSNGRIYSADGRLYLRNATANFIVATAGGVNSTVYVETGAFYVRDYAGLNTRLTINSSGNIIAGVDMRSPIFYDSDNTAYYVDATSTTNLNNITANTVTIGLPNVGGTTPVKTFSVVTNSQGANNATYELCRISRDVVNWSTNVLEITVYNLYMRGGMSRWVISYNQVDAGTVELMAEAGTIPHKLYLGNEVTVAGNIRYRPVLIDLPAYTIANIEMKYKYTEVASISASSQLQFVGTYTTNASATGTASTTTAIIANNSIYWNGIALPAAGTSFGNPNTIGRSDSNGYTFFNYINSNTGNSENPTVSQIIVTNGSDNYYRKASLAHLKSSLGTIDTANNATYAYGKQESQLAVSSATTATGATYLNGSFSSAGKDDITTRTNSGFWESSTGTTAEGWPLNNGGWQHLLATTHSNGSNYYSMQLAADFYSNSLFYRSTNGSGTTAWNRVALYNNAYSDNLRATVFYDNDNTAFYFDGASTTNINTLSGNGKTVLSTGDTYLRINENMAFTSGTWFGGTMITSTAYYAGGNGGTTNSRVHIAGGTYNGTRVLFLDGSDGSISAAGNITAYSSDKRLKTNVKPIENALQKVMTIGGYTFDWDDKVDELGFIPDTRTNDAGVLAQEIQAVLPQAVAPAPFDWQWDEKQEKNASKSGENYLTVRYERIVPLLIEAIKEQQAYINRLEEKIDTIVQKLEDK